MHYLHQCNIFHKRDISFMNAVSFIITVAFLNVVPAINAVSFWEFFNCKDSEARIYKKAWKLINFCISVTLIRSTLWFVMRVLPNVLMVQRVVNYLAVHGDVVLMKMQFVVLTIYTVVLNLPLVMFLKANVYQRIRTQNWF